MRYWAWLAKYPISVVADACGVGVATAKKWRSRGVIPDTHKGAIASIKQMYIASPAKMRATLRDTDIYTLSEFTGASISTVKKWKRAKSIPVDYRVFLVDRFSEKLSEPIIASLRKEMKSTKNFTFSEIGWSVDDTLSEPIIAEIIRLVSKYKFPRIARLQARFIGSASLGFNDSLLKYPLVEYKFFKKSVRVTVKWYSGVYYSKKDLIPSVKSVLEEQLNKDMLLKTVTILVRERKKGGK